MVLERIEDDFVPIGSGVEWGVATVVEESLGLLFREGEADGDGQQLWPRCGFLPAVHQMTAVGILYAGRPGHLRSRHLPLIEELGEVLSQSHGGQTVFRVLEQSLRGFGVFYFMGYFSRVFFHCHCLLRVLR